jgi:PAS domain S-box-containing protein
MMESLVEMAEEPDRRRHIERLIQRLSETDEALQALGAGEVDAVVDPSSAVPILLSRAQKALHESESRHRDLISRCPAIVCEIAPQGDMRLVNDAVHRMLGYEPGALVGKLWWEELVPADHRGDAKRLISIARRRDVSDFELPLRAADGSTRWLAWTTANRYADDGQLMMVVAFGIDVTERKKVDDATRDMHEAQLARTEAEAANKAKMDFLAVMSHELRTPLNSIGGYAELIEMGLRGPVTGAQREDLNRIRRSQRHLLGLINDLMNFAKLETGHVELSLTRVSVNEVLAVLDALTEPQVTAKGIQYHSSRCDPDIHVWADREKTHQILINLVSNAVKFTRSNGSIGVQCGTDGDFVRFRVMDTGEGIPPEKLASIFEPFVQVKTGFTREHEGVGLGLAISRDLARMMHGDLTVASALGAGSTFTLNLPRNAPEP